MELVKDQQIFFDKVLKGDNVFLNGKSDYFKRFVKEAEIGAILAPHNSTVNKYNEKGFKSVEGQIYHFDAHVEGNVKDSDFNVESTIKLKDGCKNSGRFNYFN